MNANLTSIKSFFTDSDGFSRLNLFIALTVPVILDLYFGHGIALTQAW